MRLTGLFWWIDRWRKSTAYTDMTLEEQGAYRNLLDEAHLRGGPIPDDERILAKASGDATSWSRLRERIMTRFVKHPEGWRNATLDEVLVESIRRAERQKRYRQGKASPTIKAIVARDGQVCGICAQPVEDIHACEVDHIIPLSQGGHDSDVRNLQLAHPRCNAKKGGRSCARHASLCACPGLRRHNDQYNDRSIDQLSPDPDPDPDPDPISVSGSQRSGSTQVRGLSGRRS